MSLQIFFDIDDHGNDPGSSRSFRVDRRPQYDPGDQSIPQNPSYF